MNVFDKYKDYIVFTSLKKELEIVYFKYHDDKVAVYTNRPDKLEFAFDKRFLYQDCDRSKVIGTIMVYFDEHLFEKRYDHNAYTDGEFVLKSHPMYIEGVTNSFFEIGDLEIHIFHYPHEIININNKKSYEFCAFVGVEEDIVRELLFGMKKILSRYNFAKGIFSIHGAALAKNNNGCLFLAGSRAGKSTLYTNLLFSGFAPVNDDIVFWARRNHEELVISGCATLPQLRKNTFHMVTPVQSMQKYQLNSPDLCREMISELDVAYDEQLVLQEIFIPEFGYDKSSIIEINKSDVFRQKLRACMVHGNYEIGEFFLEAMKALNALPVYKLCMSQDYNEVSQLLNHFLGDYS